MVLTPPAGLYPNGRCTFVPWTCIVFANQKLEFPLDCSNGEPTGAPHTPQNFSLPVSGVLQEGQTRGGTGTGRDGVTTGTGPETGGTVTMGAPQEPQNFLSGFSGAPHMEQRGAEGCTDAGGIGAGGAGRGGGTGTKGSWCWAAGTGACGSGWDSSSCGVPQLRQNFAFGLTLFPHSAQNGMEDHVPRGCLPLIKSISPAVISPFTGKTGVQNTFSSAMCAPHAPHVFVLTRLLLNRAFCPLHPLLG